VRLSDWARERGIHPKTAYRWFRAGTLLVPARQINARMILVEVSVTPEAAAGGVALYVRVSSHDQKDDLERQVGRLAVWAAARGLTVTRVVCEVGWGMNGSRAKGRKLLADASITTIVVEHRDRFGRMNVELVEAALSGADRTLKVVNEGEVEDDLVRDMVEVLSSFCARLYGRRSASRRAAAAVAAAAVATPCGGCRCCWF